MADFVVVEDENKSDASDEGSPPKIKKQRSTIRGGLAGLIKNKSSSDSEGENKDDDESEFNIYSTKVARCLENGQAKHYLLDMTLVDDDDEMVKNNGGVSVLSRSHGVRSDDVILVGDENKEESPSPDCSILSDFSPPTKIVVTKRTRKLQCALNILNRAKSLVDNDGLNNSFILDSNTDIISTGEKEDIMLKVLHKGNVHRINVQKSAPFYRVHDYLADELGVISTEIMLILGDRTISSTDTPNTIKLELTDIIDCHILDENSPTTTPGENLHTDHTISNGITLCVQSHSRNSKINITVDKTEPLRNLMEKYAADRKVNLCSLIFKFDGDEVNANETPDNLDMDDNDCIDAIDKETASVVDVKKTETITKQKNKRKSCRTRR